MLISSLNMEEDTKLRKNSSATIMTVKEMIETAFGDPERNIVNFRLMYSIFLILANQLRILQRQVALELDTPSSSPKTKLSVSEIKIVASSTKSKQGMTLSEQKSDYEAKTLRHKRSTHKTHKYRSTEKPTKEKSSTVASGAREAQRYIPFTIKTSDDDLQAYKFAEKHSTEKTGPRDPERYKSAEKPVAESESYKYKSEEDTSAHDLLPEQSKATKMPDHDLHKGKFAEKSTRAKSPHTHKKHGDTTTKKHSAHPGDREPSKKEMSSMRDSEITPSDKLSVMASSQSSPKRTTEELARRSVSEPLKTSSTDVKPHGTDFYGSSLRTVTAIDSDRHVHKKVRV